MIGHAPLAAAYSVNTCRLTTVIRLAKFRRLFFALLIPALGLIGYQRWSQWHDTPLQPRWTDLREGDGFIHSLTSGRDPQGTEVIVAAGYLHSDRGPDLRVVSYAAADGKVLWERRYRRLLLGDMGALPTVVVDRAGNVLIGWSYRTGGHNTDPVIEKLSGANGQTLWTWTAELLAKEQLLHAAIPKPDGTGQVWVRGVQPLADRSFERYLALLDSDTGLLRWKRPLNAARDPDDRHPVLHLLADGDALVFVPPPGEVTDFEIGTWRLQRISRETGKTSWEQTFSSRPNVDICDLTSLLDDARDQVIVTMDQRISTPTESDQYQREFRSFRLGDGGERWGATYPIDDNLVGAAPQLRKSGSIASFEIRNPQGGHHLWVFLEYLPQWVPTPRFETGYQAVQVTVSTRDGSLLSRSDFGELGDSLKELLVSPNEARAALVIEGESDSPQAGWRIVPMDGRQTAPRRSIFRQQIMWPNQIPYRDRLTITDSGKIVLSGDPQEEHHPGWQVRVWE